MLSEKIQQSWGTEQTAVTIVIYDFIDLMLRNLEESKEYIQEFDDFEDFALGLKNAFLIRLVLTI